jgi:hypothetical protein
MSAARQPAQPTIQEVEFQGFVLQNIGLAESLMDGYHFGTLRAMIQDVGAVETAKRLLHPSHIGHPYDGFNMLAKWQLLHLSLEQAVVMWRSSGLFHSSLISAAEVRLKIASQPRRLNS